VQLDAQAVGDLFRARRLSRLLTSFENGNLPFLSPVVAMQCQHRTLWQALIVTENQMSE
jgi:hypothetical protein